MENILKKALKEVLTPRYSEELRNAYDTGYKPTDEFENGMHELIRKTDRPPIYRYTRYIAAAAAVVGGSNYWITKRYTPYLKAGWKDFRGKAS